MKKRRIDFPLKFILATPENLNYVGCVPPIEIFFNISPEEYKDYVSRFEKCIWNLIEELERYCEMDCISLYKVIESFNILIWDLFKVDTHSVVTLSSLAIKIFPSIYLKILKIPTITGIIFLDLIKSFTGGAVEVYKPHGENIKRVDVNSLYPPSGVIIINIFPIGTPLQFIGDYRKISTLESKLAIIEVEVETPEDLDHPVLIVKNKDGINYRPLGSWVGWYTSKELENAAKFGYKYKILRGYLFDYGEPFKDYVKTLYQLRIENPKGTPLNLIAKLLLNSLFGRFGKKPLMDETRIIDLIELEHYFSNFIVKDVIEIENNKCLVVFSPFDDPQKFYENLEWQINKSLYRSQFHDFIW